MAIQSRLISGVYCEPKKMPAKENHDKNAESTITEFQWARALMRDAPAAVTEREAGEYMVDETRGLHMRTQHQGAVEQEHSERYSEEEINQLQTWRCFCANACMQEKLYESRRL